MAALNLPTKAKIKATGFKLQRLQAFNPVRGGYHQTVDLGEPLWVADLATTPLSQAQGGVYKALLARARGMARTILLYDADRPRPLAYSSEASDAAVRIGRGVHIGESRRIGGPSRPWGAPFVTEASRADSLLRVAGCIAGASFAEGDYVAFKDGAAQRLFMVVEAAIMDSAGRGALLVEPQPPASMTLPAALELHKPCGEFVIMDGRADMGGPGVRDASIKALQIINRS